MRKTKSSLSRQTRAARRSAMVRKTETPEQRAIRLEKVRCWRAYIRSQETPEERANRLQKNRLDMASSRSSAAQRKAKLLRNQIMISIKQKEKSLENENCCAQKIEQTHTNKQERTNKLYFETTVHIKSENGIDFNNQILYLKSEHNNDTTPNTVTFIKSENVYDMVEVCDEMSPIKSEVNF